MTVKDPEDPKTGVDAPFGGTNSFGFSNENCAIPVYIRGDDENDESEGPFDTDSSIHIHDFKRTWLPGNGIIVIPETEFEPQTASIAVWFENSTEDEGFRTSDQSRKFLLQFAPGQKQRELWYDGQWDYKDPGAVNGNFGYKQLASRQKKK